MTLRVANLAQHTFTLNRALDTQSRLQDLQAQIATGRKSLAYAGISADAAQLVSLEGQLTRVQQFQEGNILVDQRLSRMDSAIGTIFDSMLALRSLLQQELNAPSTGNVPLADEAQNHLDTVVSQLNLKVNGRFLFAGSKTTTQPVQSPPPDPAVFGVPEASYYDGDSVELTARIAEDREIQYGVTADRLVFQETIGALQAAIEGDNTDDLALVDAALALTVNAIDVLPEIRAEVGAAQLGIADQNKRHEDFVVFTGNVVSNIENVDVPSAVSRLASEETLLEASYLTLVRVGSLTLADFLR